MTADMLVLLRNSMERQAGLLGTSLTGKSWFDLEISVRDSLVRSVGLPDTITPADRANLLSVAIVFKIDGGLNNRAAKRGLSRQQQKGHRSAVQLQLEQLQQMGMPHSTQQSAVQPIWHSTQQQQQQPPQPLHSHHVGLQQSVQQSAQLAEQQPDRQQRHMKQPVQQSQHAVDESSKTWCVSQPATASRPLTPHRPGV